MGLVVVVVVVSAGWLGDICVGRELLLGLLSFVVGGAFALLALLLFCFSGAGLLPLGPVLIRLLAVLELLLLFALLEVLLVLFLLHLLVHVAQALVLAPTAGLVDVELAAAGAGAGALDVGDDLGRRSHAPIRLGAWDVYVAVWLCEQGLDVGGELAGTQGALLGGTVGARVCGGGHGLGDVLGHGGYERCKRRTRWWCFGGLPLGAGGGGGGGGGGAVGGSI